MKKLLTAVAASLLLVGCMTQSQQTTAYKSLYSVEKTTTAAVDGYYASVVKGLCSTNGIPVVAKSYNGFQAHFALAVELAHNNTNAIAPMALVTESQDVLNIITYWKGVK